MPGTRDAFEGFFAAVARRPGRVIVAALFFAALALWPARQVRVETDLVALLPSGSPAADAYRVFLERFGGLEKVFVLVLPGDVDEAFTSRVETSDLVHAASLLEEELSTSDEVASVRAGFGPDDEAFFARWVAPRAPLLLDSSIDDVAKRLEPAAVAARVDLLEASIASPTWGARALLARGDPLGFADELVASMAPGGLSVDPLTSTFLSPTGDAALLVLTPARAEIDPEGGRALVAAISAAEASVREALDLSAADLRLLAVGGPLYAAQDEEQIRSDLRGTIGGSILGTALVLILAFEGFAVPLALLAPLVVALAWTAGGLGALGAPTSAVSLGFAAVLVGLGIDYALHAGARFRQRILAGDAPAVALVATARHTGPGILTSAATTAASFAVLGFAHFRPLAELGRVVPLGIVAILVAAATFGAALLVRSAPRLRRPGPVWHALGRAVEALVDLGTNRPRAVLLGAGVVSLVAGAGLFRLQLDADPSVFRPDDHPALEAEQILAERFGLGSDTANLVIAGRDLPEALARADAASDLLRASLGPGASITDPSEVLGPGAAIDARLARFAELPFGRAADQLEVDLREANLAPRAFADGLDALRALGRGEDPGLPPRDAWPDWLAESIVVDPEAAPGEPGAWVAVRLRLPAGSWPDGPPADLVASLEAVAPGAALASATALGAELRALAVRDLELLGVLALFAVASMVLVSFRGDARSTALALVPVLIGSLWTLGLSSAAGRPLDLFGLAVLPILLGIGIDDGLHVLHAARARRNSTSVIAEATRHAGRAISLTTLTTCVGFASLLLSELPGLRHGGLLVAGGVLACGLVTLVVLPALEAIRRGRGAAR